MIPSHIDISAIVLKVDNPNFRRSPSYDLAVWGRSMLEWVCAVFEGKTVVCADYKQDDSVRKITKSLCGGSEYLAVVYSDTPLLTSAAITEAVELMEKNSLGLCRLTRGFVVRSDSLESLDKLSTARRYFLSEEDDFLTAYDFKQLALISDVMRNRILTKHMSAGVYILDPGNTYIDGAVVIEDNVTVGPNNHIKGRSVIRRGAVLREGNSLTDAVVGERTELISSQIVSSEVGADCHVGPYAYLRPNSKVGNGCKVGDFVELKSATMGDGSKASHLSYLGDCELGVNCNVGCGVVFCNYDGKNKRRTVVGNNVFIGSNSNLIAPLVIEDNAYIAAGSTITDNIESYALAVARARQINKPNWNNKNSEDKD